MNYFASMRKVHHDLQLAELSASRTKRSPSPNSEAVPPEQGAVVGKSAVRGHISRTLLCLGMR
jgi:hypothetical protein